MGRLRRSRTHHAQRDVHRAARTRVRILYRKVIHTHSCSIQVRGRDLDQIQLIDLDPKVARNVFVFVAEVDRLCRFP